MKYPAKDLLTHLKSQIGAMHSFTPQDPLASATFRQYFEAIGDFNPVYFDTEIAESIGFESLIARPTLICESEQFSGTVEENTPFSQRTFLNGHWYNWLRAGNNYEFYNSAKVGDVISTKKTFEDVWLKKGENGTHIFKKINIYYRNQSGETLAKNEEIMFVTLA